MTDEYEYGHCCAEMTRHLDAQEISIVYNDRHREYGILTTWQLNRSGAKQNIGFCPWCGTKLPQGLSDTWFDLLGDMGLEPEDPGVPEEMRSDAWWRKRGL